MKKRWTEDKCVKSARKYRTIREWSLKDPAAYKACRRYGWSEACYAHFKRKGNKPHKPHGYWTLPNLKKDARKYDTRTQWQNANPTAYQRARIEGWLELCCHHMRAPWGKKSEA